MRYLDRPVTVHMDHVSAVLDVDYSPTGKEFVSASFDKTIRIFPKDGGRSRSVTPFYKSNTSVHFRKVVNIKVFDQSYWDIGLYPYCLVLNKCLFFHDNAL